MELRPIEVNVDPTDSLYASKDCQLLIQSMAEYYQKIGFFKPWVGYFAIDRNRVVGTGSFVSAPTNGIVEIAYWTFKAFEGQGVASFICQHLVEIALAADPTIIITAKTAPEHNASTKILINNGFAKTDIVTDHEIGEAWLWTLYPPSSQSD
jgi:RimJ/RimL family protein N-acetyltransferase